MRAGFPLSFFLFPLSGLSLFPCFARRRWRGNPIACIASDRAINSRGSEGVRPNRCFAAALGTIIQSTCGRRSGTGMNRGTGTTISGSGACGTRGGEIGIRARGLLAKGVVALRAAGRVLSSHPGRSPDARVVSGVEYSEGPGPVVAQAKLGQDPSLRSVKFPAGKLTRSQRFAPPRVRLSFL